MVYFRRFSRIPHHRYPSVGAGVLATSVAIGGQQARMTQASRKRRIRKAKGGGMLQPPRKRRLHHCSSSSTRVPVGPRSDPGAT